MKGRSISTLIHPTKFPFKHLKSPYFLWKPKSQGYATHFVVKELEVPTFCDISVDLSCNVRIKPLNVHKYSDSNQLIIQMDKECDKYIESTVDGNQVIIKDKFSEKHDIKDILCNIKAPVKANLDIRSQRDITVGYFQGDKVRAQSVDGNVLMDRFQGISCKVFTKSGNINFKNYLQAAEIVAKSENGSIQAGRLQGLDLKVEIENGDLEIESSYCDTNEIKVTNGNLRLHNLHRDCSIIVQNGNLYLTGFDGTLKALILNGSAEIFLSRLAHTSEITLKNNNTLDLKVADTCYTTSHFAINSKNINLTPNIENDAKKVDTNRIIFSPKEKIEGNVIINCPDGSVNVETCSWQEMILMKLRKQS